MGLGFGRSGVVHSAICLFQECRDRGSGEEKSSGPDLGLRVQNQGSVQVKGSQK